MREIAEALPSDSLFLKITSTAQRSRRQGIGNLPVHVAGNELLARFFPVKGFHARNQQAVQSTDL